MVLLLRRGVSGLIAVLILGLVMVSLISTAITLSFKLREGVEESSLRASRILSEASQPPILSLYSFSGSLYVEILTSRALELRGFIVELPNGIFFKPASNVTVGVSRFKVVDDYNCEPVRVHVLLASGLIVSYDPRLDPRIRFIPDGWDGRWSCNIVRGSAGGSGIRDPRVWLETIGLGGGGNNTLVLDVRWQNRISTYARVGASMDLSGYTWGECSIYNPYSYGWESEVIVRSFTINNSRVDVILGCTRGWPIAVYLALKGPQDMVYSGRVDFSYRVTYRTSIGYTDKSEDPSIEGPLPIAYTPVGISSYIARRSSWIPTTTTIEWTYEGIATINYMMSSVLVLLTWAYMRPDPFIGFYNKDNPYVTINIDINIRVDNVTKVMIEPIALDLGSPSAVRVKLYRYNITSSTIIRDKEPTLVREQITWCTPVYDSWGKILGYECRPYEKVYIATRRTEIPEPLSHAIYNVYQKLLPEAPKVEIVASIGDLEVRRVVEPGKVTEISFPGARIKLSMIPHVHSPLYNGITTSYRDIGGTREYTGGTQPAPNLSPWRGPALIEIELPQAKFLTAISWPGILTITQANITYKGYAQLLGDKPYTITPNISYRVAKTLIDSTKLKVIVEQTLDSRKGWITSLNTYTSTHITITITSRKPYEMESIIAWVN